MKPGFETASSSKAAHEIIGLLLVLSSLSAPQRAPTVWTCGPALWFSVCRIWFCSVIFFISFSALLLAGHHQRQAEPASAGRRGIHSPAMPARTGAKRRPDRARQILRPSGNESKRACRRVL